MAQTVMNLPAMQETQLCSLEKETTTHSSILAWEIPWTEKPGGLLWGHKELDMTEQLTFLLSRCSKHKMTSGVVQAL